MNTSKIFAIFFIVIAVVGFLYYGIAVNKQGDEAPDFCMRKCENAGYKFKKAYNLELFGVGCVCLNGNTTCKLTRDGECI